MLLLTSRPRSTPGVGIEDSVDAFSPTYRCPERLGSLWDDRTCCRWHGMTPSSGRFAPDTVRARQAGVISKHPGPARAGPQPSEQPRSNSPISQCHRRVRVLVDLTPDELSDLGGSI